MILDVTDRPDPDFIVDRHDEFEPMFKKHRTLDIPLIVAEDLRDILDPSTNELISEKLNTDPHAV
jgi:hypothetical protein